MKMKMKKIKHHTTYNNKKMRKSPRMFRYSSLCGSSKVIKTFSSDLSGFFFEYSISEHVLIAFFSAFSHFTFTESVGHKLRVCENVIRCRFTQSVVFLAWIIKTNCHSLLNFTFFTDFFQFFCL